MSVTVLPLGFCLLIDFPVANKDCDNISKNGTSNKENCFECYAHSEFLFGGRLGDNSSPGLIICIILAVLSISMGIFGSFANALVILVVRNRAKRTSFGVLLYILAAVDLLNSVTSSMTTVLLFFFYANWDRGQITLNFYLYISLLFYVGKSVSAFMTVLITVERYIVVAFPIRSRGWFTATTAKIMAALTTMFAILLHIARWSSVRIVYNKKGQNVPSIDKLEYIMTLEQAWYRRVESIHFFDALAPFPLLILFNFLLFMKISKLARIRQQLTNQQKVDISAARMFVPVVIMLFLCNVEPMAFYLSLKFKNIVYRELVSAFFLSIAVNSAANLPIYYARGSSFREEVRQCLPNCAKRWFTKGPTEENITGSGEA